MATIGVRTLAMVFGAGYGGTYLYNNSDKARSFATDILLQTRSNQSSDTSNANSHNPDISLLSKQMETLTREVSKAGDRSVVIMGQGNDKRTTDLVTDILSTLGWSVTAVVVGGIVFYIARWRGVSLRDLAWVSQSTFNDTILAMQKGITRVSGAVGAVRRDLGERLKMIEARVDKVRTSLTQKIETEVAEVKDGITEVGTEVTNVQDMLGDVNSRIEQLDTKIDTATTGIVALVRVVSSLAPDGLRPGTPFYDLRRFAELTSSDKPAELPGTQALLRHRVSHNGLGSLLVQAAAKDSIDATAEQSSPAK